MNEHRELGFCDTVFTAVFTRVLVLRYARPRTPEESTDGHSTVLPRAGARRVAGA